MHELGLCDALLRMVRKIVVEEELTEVHRITLEIGELSGVLPHYMADCWQAVIDGTELAETELVLHTVPGTARCLDCGAEFQVDPQTLRCPDCASAKLLPLTGNDMTVQEIEAS